MGDQFYYADENSQPVGPLSLEELRKIAEAGVVPQDVMVCEAGSDAWRSLDSIGQPTPPMPTDSAPHPSPKSPQATPAPSVRTLKVVYTAALAVSLVAFLLGTISDRSSVQSGDLFAPNSSENLATVFWLLSIASCVALIYVLITSLPERHRFTSPIKGAGFFLIPVFSIYWVFRLFPGMVNGARKWLAETAPEKPRRIAWLTPFATFAAILFAVSEVLGYAGIVWLSNDPPLDGWKGVIFISGLASALSAAAFFQFALSLIHILRALIDLEDIGREEERAKRTPFWKFRRRPWNPSYAWLFPVLFVAIWLTRAPQ